MRRNPVIHPPHDHGEGKKLLLLSHLSKPEEFALTADIFACLGDGTRVRIFFLLCHLEECVSNLASILRISSPAVCHHLRILKQAGLIQSRREGKEVFYSAAKTEAALLLHRTIEEVMEITCSDAGKNDRMTEAPAEDGDGLIREIHDYLLSHLDGRVTVESISHLYPINKTTLNSRFRAIYGDSVASHIKKHRMEEAARLLSETSLTVAEIARRVGYDSQSRFTAAFKAQLHLLPTEYRREEHSKKTDR